MENLASIEEKVLLGNSKDDDVKTAKLVKFVANGSRNSDLGTNVDNGSVNPTADPTMPSANIIADENSNIAPTSNMTDEKYPIIIINADENERHKLDFEGEDGAVSSMSSLKEKANPFMPVSSSKISQAESDELSEEDLLNRKLNYLKDKLRQRKILNHMHEIKLAELESKFHPGDLPAKMINEIPSSSLAEGTALDQHQSAEQGSGVIDRNLPAISPISGTTSAEAVQQQISSQQENPSAFTSQGEGSKMPFDPSQSMIKNLTDAGSNRGTMEHGAPAPQTMFSFSYDPKSPFGKNTFLILFLFTSIIFESTHCF